MIVIKIHKTQKLCRNVIELILTFMFRQYIGTANYATVVSSSKGGMVY